MVLVLVGGPSGQWFWHLRVVLALVFELAVVREDGSGGDVRALCPHTRMALGFNACRELIS